MIDLVEKKRNNHQDGRNPNVCQQAIEYGFQKQLVMVHTCHSVLLLDYGNIHEFR